MPKSRGLRVQRGTRAAWAKANQGKFVCACGCGGVITLQPRHFNVGVPTYLHGHNPQPPRAKKPKAPVVLIPGAPCACGCGQLTSVPTSNNTASGRVKGVPMKYVSGHNSYGRKLSAESRAKIAAAHTGERSHRYGKRPHNYKGGIQRHGSGYIMQAVEDHPFGGVKKVVMQHRLFLEAHLREHEPDSPYLVDVDGVKYLSPDAHAHHIDGVKDNNVIENLRPLWADEHTNIHRELLVTARQRQAADARRGND